MSDDGTILYVGGSFTDISGSTRNGIAALNAATGAVLNWNPNAMNGSVDALAVAGNGVYAGGQFTAIGGQTRTHLAKLLANVDENNADLGWAANANAGGSVNALAVSGSKVYVGGSFTNVGGQTHSNLAVVSTTGTATAWNPNADGAVNALVVAGETVYAGGSFNTVGGSARSRLGTVSASTGSATLWSANVTGTTVNALALAGQTLYVGGNFSQVYPCY